MSEGNSVRWVEKATESGGKLAEAREWLRSFQDSPVAQAKMIDGLIGLIPSTVKLEPAEYERNERMVRTVGALSVPVVGNALKAELPDAEIIVYRPKSRDDEKLPVVLWTHGGGWVAGRPEMIADYSKAIAARGYVVALLRYSLAPKYRFPTQATQAIAALNYLVKHADFLGIDAEKLFVGGESAGGNITATTASIVSNPQLAQELGIEVDFDPSHLLGAVLYCGIYDLEAVQHLGFPLMKTMVWAETGVKDATSETYPLMHQVSPMRNATAHFPPSYITVGDADQLESQSKEFGAVLKDLGVEVQERYWGKGHGYGHDYVYHQNVYGGKVVFDEMVEFLNRLSR